MNKLIYPGSALGNNRNTQNLNGRNVYQTGKICEKR